MEEKYLECKLTIFGERLGKELQIKGTLNTVRQQLVETNKVAVSLIYKTNGYDIFIRN